MLRNLLLLDTTDTTAVLDGMRNSSASIWCIYSRYGSDADEKTGEVEKYSVNTEERFKAYARFNAAASGHSAVMPRGMAVMNKMIRHSVIAVAVLAAKSPRLMR